VGLLSLSSSSEIAAVILCGGRAARMGGITKTLLRRPEGDPLVVEIEAALAPLVAEVWVAVSPWTEDEVRAVSRSPIIRDGGRGPAAALRTAADETGAGWLLPIGGDQPRAMPEVLKRLSPFCKTSGSGAIAARAGGVLQPLPALYRAAAVRAESELEDKSLRELLRRIGVVEIEAEDLTSAFASVNTWEQAQALGLTCVGPRPPR
jgi:molybdopterin-guanine dinucleotide biosynthesis protein A